MNDNNIVSIKGKQLSDEEAQAVAAKRQPFIKELEPAPIAGDEGEEGEPLTHKEANIKMLRDVRNLVENDQLEGVIIIGRQKGGEYFLTDHCLDRRVVSHNQLFAYVGVLDVLKRELGDIALMAPCVLPSGEIADPNAEGVSL